MTVAAIEAIAATVAHHVGLSFSIWAVFLWGRLSFFLSRTLLTNYNTEYLLMANKSKNKSYTMLQQNNDDEKAKNL